ncbi:uncharacterized protein MELLADRAFT_89711 [Melampsora larici-populina 98AG31]|uniref:Uncharacterized protein n=1 Tax=Melampsora larici-populina (strain 98AG31 / pathotype 3-4-7) TaxID=747676 RepID=F4RUC5_MELLP|nr:uncharacterized protein MELLADRAFT_89711 [Melampsora larici-populina 98AG31]EGG03911.1 hypothetical protein MELLADRAFT_89711 [Melampsora larici-populina 98AG31]
MLVATLTQALCTVQRGILSLSESFGSRFASIITIWKSYPVLDTFLAEFSCSLLLTLLSKSTVAEVFEEALDNSTTSKSSSRLIVAIGAGGASLLTTWFGTMFQSEIYLEVGITIGLTLLKQIPASHMIPRIIAQVLGALVGMILVYVLFHSSHLSTVNPISLTQSSASIGTTFVDGNQSLVLQVPYLICFWTSIHIWISSRFYACSLSGNGGIHILLEEKITVQFYDTKCYLQCRDFLGLWLKGIGSQCFN